MTDLASTSPTRAATRFPNAIELPSTFHGRSAGDTAIGGAGGRGEKVVKYSVKLSIGVAPRECRGVIPRPFLRLPCFIFQRVTPGSPSPPLTPPPPPVPRSPPTVAVSLSRYPSLRSFDFFPVRKWLSSHLRKTSGRLEAEMESLLREREVGPIPGARRDAPG